MHIAQKNGRVCITCSRIRTCEKRNHVDSDLGESSSSFRLLPEPEHLRAGLRAFSSDVRDLEVDSKWLRRETAYVGKHAPISGWLVI